MITILISLLLVIVCYFDFKQRKIHNKIVLCIMLLSLISVAVRGDYSGFLLPLLVLFFGFILNKIGIIGAGDIKLIFALMLGLEASLYLDFLFSVAMCGLILSLAYIAYYMIFYLKADSIPYGLAISAGYWLIAMHEVFL